MKRFTHFWTVVALLVALSGETAVAISPYHITDLGTLGGTYSQARGINIHGDVVGSSTTTSGDEHAFLYHDGAMTDLGVLYSGDTSSQSHGINDSGIVVGRSVGATSNPFYTSGDQMHFVGSLGGNYGWATGITNAGQIVGISADSNGNTHAFLATNGSMTDLGTLSNTDNYTIAYGVNELGSVTGYSSGPNMSEAFLFRNGQMHGLGNLGGYSRGFAVNNLDHVAGASIINSNGDEHAFFWHDGTMTDLGTTAGAITSQGLGMNNLDQVVGTLVFDPSDGTKNHGFLFTDGVMIDVNSLLPANSGWVLRDAQGINDLGQIVGFGNIGGEQHAYLLTPVPEPSVLALIAVSGILIAIFTQHRCQRTSS
jgi:probable HAF family extracellular repeat protein